MVLASVFDSNRPWHLIHFCKKNLALKWCLVLDKRHTCILDLYLLDKSSDFLQKVVIIQNTQTAFSKALKEIRTPDSKIFLRPPKAKSGKSLYFTFLSDRFSNPKGLSHDSAKKVWVCWFNKGLQKSTFPKKIRWLAYLRNIFEMFW